MKGIYCTFQLKVIEGQAPNQEDGMAMVLFRMVKAGASEEDVLIAVKRISDLAQQAEDRP